jgi:hypothetical protein
MFKKNLKVRSVNFEMSFWYLQFYQKTKEKFDFTTMVPQVKSSQVNCFRSFFGRIEDTKKLFEIN